MARTRGLRFVSGSDWLAAIFAGGGSSPNTYLGEPKSFAWQANIEAVDPIDTLI